MGMLIDGKKISEDVKLAVREGVNEVIAKGVNPCLAVVIVGGDPASRVYVNGKKKACEYVNIKSVEYALDENTTQEELIALVDKLNADSTVHGILVQLPLPKHLNDEDIIERIDPNKDVDAFHANNVGKIMIGNYDFLPCTPSGCMDLIKSTGISISGKHCVVVGRSNIVGKPMSMLMLHESATVTICHSRTVNLAEVCKSADILIAAVGVANLITGDMVKEGAVVIDVGMNRLENGKLCGDVNFEEAKDIASHITPVPGGVGPMTIATLMRNTLTAAKIQNNLL